MNDSTPIDFKYEFRLWLQSREYDAILNHVAIDRLVRHIETEYIIPLKSEAFAASQADKAPKRGEEIEQLFRDNFDCYADNSTDGADGQIIYGENEPAMTLPVFTKLYKVAMCPFHKPAPLTKDCPHLSSHIDNNGGCYCDTCGKMMEP